MIKIAETKMRSYNNQLITSPTAFVVGRPKTNYTPSTDSAYRRVTETDCQLPLMNIMEISWSASVITETYVTTYTMKTVP